MENSIRKVNREVEGLMTPEIPVLPELVAGVKQAVILLNNRENMEGETAGSRWEFFGKPVKDIPAPDAPEQSYHFAGLGEEGWEAVLVPGELEMQGFEIENNTEYYYRTIVHIPADFGGCRCLLRFDGVYGNARVWVNDQYVRSHAGGFTTWYCDITEHAVPGRDVRLIVGIADLEGDRPGLYNKGMQRPLRDPSGASDYAHHNIGGILRDVSLVALPCTYLARLHTNVEFDCDFRDAGLQIGVQINSDESHVEVKYTLLDAEDEVCLEQNILLSDDNAGSETYFFNMDSYKKECVTNLHVKEPRHWDAEHPYLYTLKIEILAGGLLQAVYREKIGFREILFAGKRGSDRNKIYVNGREVKLRGTCRHDVSYRFGRSTTAEEDWAEIRAYKEANINHVRTSHYPVSRHFLEACDTLGMYVEEENGASFQGDNGYTIYCEPEDFTGQFTEMIERDRNHPSILIWSLANESGFEGSEGFRREWDYVRSVDASRPVIFSYPFTVHSLPLPYDILSMHYVDAEAQMGLGDIPVLHDEYMHISCYNTEELRRDPNVRNFWGRSIRKAWDRIFETEGALGGDLWGGIDDIFYLPENVKEKWQSHSQGKAAGYGAWGCVLDVFRRLKPEAYLTRKAYSPVKIEEKNVIVHGERILVPVENRFDHTNLNELTVEYTSGGRGSFSGCIMEDIPPHSTGILELKDERAGKRQPIHLKFYKDGYLVDEFVIGDALEESDAVETAKPADHGIRVEETDREIRIFAGESDFVFDKESAQMTRGACRGKLLLQGGPHLLLTGVSLGEWRKTEPGVQVTIESSLDSPAWEEDKLTGHDSFEKQKGRTGKECAVVTLAGTYENGFEVWYTITIHEDGSFHTRYLLQGGWTDKVIKELGIRYDLAFIPEKVSWLREGEYSCYPGNHIGRNRGTAYRKNTVETEVRRKQDADTDYRIVPKWDWKDDMWDDFLYSQEERENGLMTRDFRALRENIRYFKVHLSDGTGYVCAEDVNRQTAARVSIASEEKGEQFSLLIVNRWNYPDLGWGNDGKRGICVGRGTFGGAAVRFG